MRLTTDTPQGNLEQSLNLFYAKDGKTWVRGYGENGTDIALLDLMRKLICRYMEPDEIPETMSDEDVMFAMVDWLYGGTDSMEGVLALLYLAGWVCAELREFLKRFEDKENANGRWVPFHSQAAGDIWYCSACKIGFAAQMKYCPNCGAKMDLRVSDNE